MAKTIKELTSLTVRAHQGIPDEYRVENFPIRRPKVNGKNISLKDTSDFVIGNEWALDCYLYHDELQLCLIDTRDTEDGLVPNILGPVAHIEACSEDQVGIIVESHEDKQWFKYILDCKLYGVRLNTSWIHDVKKSIITLGFFGMEYDFHTLPSLSQSDVLNGYARVYFVLKKGKKFLCRTWKMEHCIEENAMPSQMIDPEVIFHSSYDKTTLSKWVSYKKGGRTRKPMEASANQVAGKEGRGEQRPLAIARGTLAKVGGSLASKGGTLAKTGGTIAEKKQRMVQKKQGKEQRLVATTGQTSSASTQADCLIIEQPVAATAGVNLGGKYLNSARDRKRKEVEGGQSKSMQAKKKRNGDGSLTNDVHSDTSGHGNPDHEENLLVAFAQPDRPVVEQRLAATTGLNSGAKHLDSARGRKRKDIQEVQSKKVQKKRNGGGSQTTNVCSDGFGHGNPDDNDNFLIASTQADRPIVLREIGGKEDLELPEGKQVEKSQQMLQQVKAYFPFGIKQKFPVPVKDILQAPSTMCYRKLNMRHVEEIMEQMLSNPGQEPHVADLVAYDPVEKSLMVFKEGDLAEFNKIRKRLKFFAISGQHSAHAANIICEYAAITPDLQELADKLKVRWSRILCGSTPSKILLNVSQNSNVMNKVGNFKSPFIDTVEHARNQYADMSKPQRPKPGQKKLDSFQDFEAMAKSTLDKKGLNEVNWILFASDELYKLWKEVCHQWLEGELPDGQGEVTGSKKDAKTLTVANFRCFGGDLKDEDIMAILQKVQNGDALLKKDVSFKKEFLSMEELAKSAKVLSKLKLVIKNFYQQTFPLQFPSTCTWKDVEEQIPFFDDKEFETCQRAATVPYLEKFLSRNVKCEDTFPSMLAFRLNSLYHDQFGGSSRKRLEPYRCIFSENLLTTSEPATMEEAAPYAPLAVVDFGKQDQREWTTCQLEVFFKYIVNMPKNDTMVIVIFVSHGRLFSNVLNALYMLSDIQVHLEYGSYEKIADFKHTGRFCKNEREQIILVGISQNEKQKWEETFDDANVHFAFDSEADQDFVQSGWKTDFENSPGDESSEDKEVRLKKEAYKTLKHRAPRYSDVDLSGSFVNPHCKPRRVLMEIISQFSSNGDTVLDFFSGGSVLKCAFQAGRECVVYSDTRKEYEFMKLYPSILRKIPCVEKLWEKVERINRVDNSEVEKSDAANLREEIAQEVEKSDAANLREEVVQEVEKSDAANLREEVVQEVEEEEAVQILSKFGTGPRIGDVPQFDAEEGSATMQRLLKSSKVLSRGGSQRETSHSNEVSQKES